MKAKTLLIWSLYVLDYIFLIPALPFLILSKLANKLKKFEHIGILEEKTPTARDQGWSDGGAIWYP
jgi:hypothetical protein